MRTFRLLLLSALIASSPLFAASRFYVSEPQDLQNRPYLFGTLVQIIDPATNTLIGSVTVNHSPSSMLASAGDGSRLYVSYSQPLFGTGMAGAIDTITNTIVQSVAFPSLGSGAITADGTRIYTCSGVNIAVLDTTTMTALASFSMPGGSSAANLVLSPDGSRLYVTDRTAGNIYVMNTSTGAVASTIPETPCTLCNGTDVGAGALAISPDGTRLYAMHGGNRYLLTAFDTATNTALLTTSVAIDLIQMTITPDGNKLYAFEPLDDGPYYVINTTDLVPQAVRDFSDAWPAVAFTADSATAYMTHYGNNGAVAEVDVASNNILADIPLSTGSARTLPRNIIRAEVPSASPFSSYNLNSVKFKTNEVDVKATFVTTATVNPPTQRFTYVLGAYGIQIPAGSFTGNGPWVYDGTLNGIDIQARITGGNRNYTLSLTLKGNTGIINQQLPLNTMLELGSSLYGTGVAN